MQISLADVFLVQPSMNIRIRPASPDDALRLGPLAILIWLHTYGKEGISNAMARYVLDNYTPQQCLRRLSSPQHHSWVIEQGDHLHGYMTVRHADPHPLWGIEIETLYLQPHLSRQGWGRQCLTLARELATRLHGRPDVWLSVNQHNLPALAFYQACGLAEVGESYFELDGERHRNLIFSSALPA